MEYKILVADDDKEIREAIEIYLTNEQMKVLTACDGQEALKVLEANPDIHLIIMDLMMPKTVYKLYSKSERKRKYLLLYFLLNQRIRTLFLVLTLVLMTILQSHLTFLSLLQE